MAWTRRERKLARAMAEIQYGHELRNLNLIDRMACLHVARAALDRLSVTSKDLHDALKGD